MESANDMAAPEVMSFQQFNVIRMRRGVKKLIALMGIICEVQPRFRTFIE